MSESSLRKVLRWGIRTILFLCIVLMVAEPFLRKYLSAFYDRAEDVILAGVIVALWRGFLAIRTFGEKNRNGSGNPEPQFNEETPHGRTEYALFRAFIACFFLDVASMIILFLLPDEQKWKAAIPFMVFFVAMGVLAVIFNHISNKSRDGKTGKNIDKK